MAAMEWALPLAQEVAQENAPGTIYQVAAKIGVAASIYPREGRRPRWSPDHRLGKRPPSPVRPRQSATAASREVASSES